MKRIEVARRCPWPDGLSAYEALMLVHDSLADAFRQKELERMRNIP